MEDLVTPSDLQDIQPTCPPRPPHRDGSSLTFTHSDAETHSPLPPEGPSGWDQAPLCRLSPSSCLSRKPLPTAARRPPGPSPPRFPLH